MSGIEDFLNDYFNTYRTTSEDKQVYQGRNKPEKEESDFEEES